MAYAGIAYFQNQINLAAFSATLTQIPFSATLVNVQDHSATGDGTTDDTAFIQAAIAASNPGDFELKMNMLSTRSGSDAGQSPAMAGISQEYF